MPNNAQQSNTESVSKLIIVILALAIILGLGVYLYMNPGIKKTAETDTLPSSQSNEMITEDEYSDFQADTTGVNEEINALDATITELDDSELSDSQLSDTDLNL